MKKYCHLCGALYIDGKTQPWECSGCGNLSYANDAATIDVAVYTGDGKAIIAKRGIEPFKGTYDLIGGFLNQGENFEDALKREVEEELGLQPKDYDPPVYLYSHNEKYPYSKEELGLISPVFAIKMKKEAKPVASDDVAAIEAIEVEEIDNYTYSSASWKEAILAGHKVFFG